MSAVGIQKSPTGIEGLDALTRGGLPTGRTTVVEGGPGCGKTIFALQLLIHGVRELDEPSILVTCEEDPDQIRTNAHSLGWDLSEFTEDQLYLIDARPTPDVAFVGDFDLSGLLAILTAQVQKMGVKRIVFDSLDFLLGFLADPTAVRREVYRLHHWFQRQEVTALLTMKRHDSSGPDTDFVRFMVSCALALEHRVIEGVSYRYLRVLKYRGSSFEENETPLSIGNAGLEVAHTAVHRDFESVSDERLSTGVQGLDDMLEGGYLRETSTLVSGDPGTAKTSLCGAFAQAACERGEHTLYISYDTRGPELVRNLASINLELQPHIDSGLLRIEWCQAFEGNAELQLMNICKSALEHQARHLIIDPLSALERGGLLRSSIERLVSWARSERITMLCSSLRGRGHQGSEDTPIEISTLADSWIHLSYHEQAGERNRGLSIMKARGTAHSNQVRELILSDSGISLAEVYQAGGEVLMGTLRLEKEIQQSSDEAAKKAEFEANRLLLVSEVASLKAKLAGKTAEEEALEKSYEAFYQKRNQTRRDVRQMRGGRDE